MSADEIIKHIPEITTAARGVAALGAAIPFTAVVKRMLGPAADELAEMWRDQVRLYRYERQLKCVEKAEKMAKDAGFTPQAVPPKILFPLLEGASLEENESLHDMWAALLANASSAQLRERVRPAYISILKQMSPDEAVMLNWMHSHVEYKWPFDDKDRPKFTFTELTKGYQQLGFRAPFMSLQGCLDCLEAAQLTRVQGKRTTVRTALYELTYRGHSLIQVCQPPTPKS
jgi:hypothetical protein